MVPRVTPEDDEQVGSVERETHRVMSKRDCRFTPHPSAALPPSPARGEGLKSSGSRAIKSL